MKFTNSAGQPITFAQASVAFAIQLAIGAAFLALGWAALVVVFGAR